MSRLVAMKPSEISDWLQATWCALCIFKTATVSAQETTNGFAFSDVLLAPLRFHLLTAANEPAVHTTLTSNDVVRILGKVNRVWAQAGITFYLESLHVEAAIRPTNYLERARIDERVTLLSLRPQDSLASNCFHVFYLHQIRPNGVYFNAQGIFVKDTASLRPVEGGLDEPLPRVTAHELGHALSLVHRQNVTNLMSSGNSSTWLNEVEISQAREVARGKTWVRLVPDVLRSAHELKSASKIVEAQELFRRLQYVPLGSREQKSVLRQEIEAKR